MFTDVSLSNDLNVKFSNYLKKKETDLGLTFSIMVLQVSCSSSRSTGNISSDSDGSIRSSSSRSTSSSGSSSNSSGAFLAK